MTFKTLVYCKGFVDTSLLHKGIYHKSTPTLYSLETTIQSLCDRYTLLKVVGTINNNFFNNYIDNLIQCELVEVEVEVKGLSGIES